MTTAFVLVLMTMAGGPLNAAEDPSLGHVLSPTNSLLPAPVSTEKTGPTENQDFSQVLQALFPTNLAHFTRTNPPADEAQTRMQIARNHRLAFRFAEATACFVSILLEPAPLKLKKAALLELAVVAEEQHELARAQQVYAQYMSLWPDDPANPEILLRQGRLYQKMGLHSLAVSKFYSVMTSVLRLKPEQLEYYQQLVLGAQIEIAETHYQIGKWSEAANSYQRLLRLDAPPANRSTLHYRYVQCLSALERNPELVAQAREFLARYADAPERPEVRFLCASALKKSGHNPEALKEVLALLQEQYSTRSQDLATLAFWQRRAGNEIANRFYQEGDYLKALDVYLSLAALDNTAEWQLPVWYQLGLVYERLQQPEKAAQQFANIINHEKDLSGSPAPSLKALLEMARWRRDFLSWQVKAERSNLNLQSALTQKTSTNSIVQ